MKLYYGALSPFVRKVMVRAHEGRGELATWFAEFSKRPSMSATAPKAS